MIFGNAMKMVEIEVKNSCHRRFERFGLPVIRFDLWAGSEATVKHGADRRG